MFNISCNPSLLLCFFFLSFFLEAKSQTRPAVHPPPKTSESNNEERDTYYDNLYEYDLLPAGENDGVYEGKIDEPASNTNWKSHLINNLNVNIAVDNGAPSGKYVVIVNFTVLKDGSITNIYAENNPGFGLAEEAVRVVKTSGKWNPAQLNGKPVISIKRQPITWVVSE